MKGLTGATLFMFILQLNMHAPPKQKTKWGCRQP